MTELLNNPYFVLLVGLLIFGLLYIFIRPESAPAFIFLLFAGMGAFFETTHIQRVSLLKAVILFILFCALIVNKFFRREKIPLVNILLMLLLMSAIIISSWLNNAGLELTRAYIGTLMVALVIALSPGRETTMKYLIVAMAIWGVVNLGPALSQWAGQGWMYKSDAIHTGQRTEGLMGTSTMMGIYFVIALNAIHVLYFQAKKRTIRVLLFCVGMGLAIGLLGTLSRAAFMAWIVSFLFIQYWLHGLKLRSIVGIVLFLVILAGIGSLMNLSELMTARFSVIKKDPSAQDRIPLIKAALQYTYAHPIFGVGLSQGGLTSKLLILNTHNTFVQRLMENGIVGFGLFCILLFRSFREFMRRIRATIKQKQAGYHVGFMAALIGILVMGLLHDFSYLMPLWLVIGVGLMKWRYEEHGTH
jgi:O-antigen ligase